MARLIKITYASLVIGKDQSDASYTLTGKYSLASSYTEATFTFDVVVSNSTRASFLTSEANLIAAYRKPDQTLEVLLGSTDRHDYDPSSSVNSGFNARASCTKLGSVEDTANSARYRCSVTVQLPADLTGRSGRQSSSVSVDADPSGKRTVTIEGVYTALTTNSATDQYTSAADTYCSSVLSDVGGTYELLTRGGGFAYDDQDKVLRFRRVYREVIYRQGLSGTDVAALKEPRLVITRVTQPNDSAQGFDGVPLVAMRATYSAFVDKNESTDLAGIYSGTIRPLILAEANLVAGGTVVVHRESVDYDRDNNTIACVADLLADVGGTFYQINLDAEDVIQNGVRFVEVWDGDPYACDKYEVPELHIRTITRSTTARTSQRFAPRLGIPDVAGFHEISTRRTERQSSFGIAGDPIPYQVVFHTFVFRRANISGQPTGGDSGAGATGVGRRVPDYPRPDA